VIAGGVFSTYRGAAAKNIAKFSLATDEPDLAFSAAAGTNSSVADPTFTNSLPCDSCATNFESLTLVGTKLYVGGDAPTRTPPCVSGLNTTYPC
jgi:hypothetical protein